ncbi:MAG: aminotransferase class IV [Opitutus sp.]
MNTPPYIQACTNGLLHDARAASISPLNRGFLYGDAIYEVWRTYHGSIFAWEQHWQRLERSAASLHFGPLPLSQADAFSEIQRTVRAYRDIRDDQSDLYIRLQVSRGDGAIGLDIALADRPGYVLLVQKNAAFSDEKLLAGLTLSLATTLRRNSIDALNPAWKTGNYLNNILCLREARSRGADEVVITNGTGEVTEAAVSNIAFVRDGEVITPPLNSGLLAGVTRGFLLDQIARRAGITVREATVRPEDFHSFSECFLLSTTKDITPVGRIDHQRFLVGENSITQKLKSAFAGWVFDYTRAHPQLKVI